MPEPSAANRIAQLELEKAELVRICAYVLRFFEETGQRGKWHGSLVAHLRNGVSLGSEADGAHARAVFRKAGSWDDLLELVERRREFPKQEEADGP